MKNDLHQRLCVPLILVMTFSRHVMMFDVYHMISLGLMLVYPPARLYTSCILSYFSQHCKKYGIVQTFIYFLWGDFLFSMVCA